MPAIARVFGRRGRIGKRASSRVRARGNLGGGTRRGHAAEFGVIAAKGPKPETELGRRVTDEGVPVLAREMIGVLA